MAVLLPVRRDRRYPSLSMRLVRRPDRLRPVFQPTGPAPKPVRQSHDAGISLALGRWPFAPGRRHLWPSGSSYGVASNRDSPRTTSVALASLSDREPPPL